MLGGLLLRLGVLALLWEGRREIGGKRRTRRSRSRWRGSSLGCQGSSGLDSGGRLNSDGDHLRYSFGQWSDCDGWGGAGAEDGCGYEGELDAISCQLKSQIV